MGRSLANFSIQYLFELVASELRFVLELRACV